MADRLNEGYGDVSDNGGNKTLQGFELNRKIEGVQRSEISGERYSCSSFDQSRVLYACDKNAENDVG